MRYFIRTHIFFLLAVVLFFQMCAYGQQSLPLQWSGPKGVMSKGKFIARLVGKTTPGAQLTQGSKVIFSSGTGKQALGPAQFFVKKENRQISDSNGEFKIYAYLNPGNYLFMLRLQKDKVTSTYKIQVAVSTDNSIKISHTLADGPLPTSRSQPIAAPSTPDQNTKQSGAKKYELLLGGGINVALLTFSSTLGGADIGYNNVGIPDIAVNAHLPITRLIGLEFAYFQVGGTYPALEETQTLIGEKSYTISNILGLITISPEAFSNTHLFGQLFDFSLVLGADMSTIPIMYPKNLITVVVDDLSITNADAGIHAHINYQNPFYFDFLALYRYTMAGSATYKPTAIYAASGYLGGVYRYQSGLLLAGYLSGEMAAYGLGFDPDSGRVEDAKTTILSGGAELKIGFAF